MNNGKINSDFIKATDARTKVSILSCIANHYGISKESALREIIDVDAEHLLDYLI